MVGRWFIFPLFLMVPFQGTFLHFRGGATKKQESLKTQCSMYCVDGRYRANELNFVETQLQHRSRCFRNHRKILKKYQNQHGYQKTGAGKGISFQIWHFSLLNFRIFPFAQLAGYKMMSGEWSLQVGHETYHASRLSRCLLHPPSRTPYRMEIS